MAAPRTIVTTLARKYSSHAFSGGSAVSGHGPESVKLWRNLTLFVGVPAIILAGINAYLKHQEEHARPRPKFIPYSYLYIRTKRFPWGDGQRTFFHNPHTNALPTGYEDEQ